MLADLTYLSYVEEQDSSPTRWDRLRGARPGPLAFWYRQSPRKLFVNSWINVVPWGGPPELGRILRLDPPLSVPGMANVVLDTDGRLISFAAVPPRYESVEAAPSTPDWSILLAEAGFDRNDLTESAPRWASPVDSDSKAAWDVAVPAQEPLHIEAAAYHGRPVYFEVQGPWTQKQSESARDAPVLVVALVLVFLALIPIAAGGIVLVRRNLRMGRGDRRGAFRLALVMFLGLVLAHLCRADHTSVGAQSTDCSSPS
jgi:hypothetical protein